MLSSYIHNINPSNNDSNTDTVHRDYNKILPFVQEDHYWIHHKRPVIQLWYSKFSLTKGFLQPRVYSQNIHHKPNISDVYSDIKLQQVFFGTGTTSDLILTAVRFNSKFSLTKGFLQLRVYSQNIHHKPRYF